MTDLDGIGTLPHGLHGQDTAAKYDLKAMSFNPDATNVYDMFIWSKTPQGREFWSAQCDNPECVKHGCHMARSLTDEGRAALAEMKAQWEKENG